MIEYSLIASGPTVLCSHQFGANNYDAVAASILPNIQSSVDAKTSYTSSSNVIFHIVVENGLVYLCAADKEMGKRQPYAFLYEIKRQFTSGSLALRAQFAGEYELNRDFGPVLENQMERFSRDGSGGDQISTLKSQVEEVKGVMTQNIDKVLERGQRLEELMEKTTELESSAATFKKTSKRVHHKMWWKNTRWAIILAVVAVVVVGIIIVIILFSTGVLPPKSGGGATTHLPSTTSIVQSK